MVRKLTGKETEYTGYIIDLKPWSSGKGYFVNIDSEAKDFYGFGSCPHAMGDTIKITAAKGTGQFSEKFEVYKMDPVNDAKISDFKNQTVPEKPAAQAPAKTFKPAIDVNDSIVQQCCMKAAANLAGQVFMGREMKTKKDIDALGKQVLQFKKLFYEDIAGKKSQGKSESND